MRQTLTAIVWTFAASVAVGQEESKLPLGDRRPTPLLDPGGPAAPVLALAFSPDGKTLFAGGLDKTIRVYRAKGAGWEADVPLRVPAGRANAGAVNALAISEDGRWLAAAGRAPMRGEAWVAKEGVVIDTEGLPAAMRRDAGVIYVFDLTNPARGKVLRGHSDAIRGLAFAVGTKEPILISAAVERGSDGQDTGTIRIWDVAGEAELAARTGFPANPARLGLGGWATGQGNTELTVAVAWPESDPRRGGKLSLWDVAHNAVTFELEGSFNSVLAVLRSNDGKPSRLLSGGFANFGVAGKQRGELIIRPLVGGTPRPVGFPPVGSTHFLPRVAAQAGSAVALLLERSGATGSGRSMILSLLDPDSGGLIASQNLANIASEYPPVLAASTQGDVLAIGGFTDNRVEVYSLADLRRGDAKPIVLPGGPPGFIGVRSLDGGSAVGLITADRSEVVFDFDARLIARTAAVRQPDTPPAMAYQFLKPAVAGDRHAVQLTFPNRVVLCRLNRGAEPTAVAVLPGQPEWMPNLGPLVAVSHTDPTTANTLITLFDGTTGRPIRQLAGHLLRVRGMAFSVSRPLLASVADDGLVCIWGLKDIDRQVGTIDGLAVTEKDGAVVVESVGESLKGLLTAGDVIESIGSVKKSQAMTSVVDFVWRIAAATPGNTVSLRIRGKPQPVVVPVARGADARSPLFTLWVDPVRHEWAGWTPAGPYDVSGPAAEGRLGWLTNTGDPAAPTTFAGADQYREQFYHEGLLGRLAETLNLNDALAAMRPPPLPRLSLSIPEAEGRFVRAGPATLRVDLENLAPSFPLATAELRYRIWETGQTEEPEWIRTATTAPRPWDFDLSKVCRHRGNYTIEFELARRRGGEWVAQQFFSFQVVPAAPDLAVTLNETTIGLTTPTNQRTVTVKEPQASLAVTATGQNGEPVLVTIGVGGTDVRTLKDTNGRFPKIEVPLKPGDNMIHIRAVNQNATDATQHHETTELVFTIRYDEPMKDPAPGIEPITFTPAGERQQLNGKDVITVSNATVEAAARITATAALRRVEVVVGEGKPTLLDVSGKVFTARQTLTLTVGQPTPIAITAATANSDTAEQTATVVYWPALPQVLIDKLPTDSVVSPLLTLTGTYEPVSDPPPTIQVVVTTAGRSQSFDAKLNKTGTWAADVTLFPGRNSLALVVRNPWREQTTANMVTIDYRRPPQVIGPKEVNTGTTAVVDLMLTVKSPADLPPTAVVVDGKPVPISKPEAQAEADGVVSWIVTASQVPVKTAAGWRGTLTVIVRNAEGDSRPFAVAVRRTKPPKIDPPRITLQDPPTNTIEPQVLLRFAVASAGPLRRVEVQQAGDDGRYAQLTTIDPTQADPAGEELILKGESTIALSLGVNRVRVLAMNDGGEAEELLVVSRTEPPVRVVIEGLDEITLDGKFVRSIATSLNASVLRYGPTQSPLARVRGFVRWADQTDPALTNPNLTLTVAVNRVNHLPVRLGAAEGSIRRFESRLFLNGNNNRVRLEVRGLAHEPGGSEFWVACDQPLEVQRLHLVVIGVNLPPQDGGELARRVVYTLTGQQPRPGFEIGEFPAPPGFVRAVLYEPQVGEVQSSDIQNVLRTVAENIRTLTALETKEDWVNDVVFIYYQGEDQVENGQRWLHTSMSLRHRAGRWQEYAIRADTLPESAGLKLLLLNVQDATGRPATAHDVGMPLLRYGWMDPTARPRLLGYLERALATRVRLGDVVADLGMMVRAAEKAGLPVEYVHDEVRGRPVGRGAP
jgi:WD40 repeat protein